MYAAVVRCPLKNRLQLPFELLSDRNLDLIKALSLPTFAIDDDIFIRRLTIIVDPICGIKVVFYPVFPSTASELSL